MPIATPTTAALALTGYAPVPGHGYVPGKLALATTTYAAVPGHGIVPPKLSLATTRYAPAVKSTITVLVWLRTA